MDDSLEQGWFAMRKMTDGAGRKKRQRPKGKAKEQSRRLSIEALDPRLVLSANAVAHEHGTGKYDVIHVDGTDGHFHVHADGHTHFYGHSHLTHSDYLVGVDDDNPPCPICGEFHGPGVHDQLAAADNNRIDVGTTGDSATGTDDDNPPCPICGQFHGPGAHDHHGHSHGSLGALGQDAYALDGVVVNRAYRDLDVTGYTGAPEIAARDYLSDYAHLLGIPQDAVDSLSVIDARHGLAGSHVYFQQMYDGTLIQDALINVSMDTSGTIKTVNTSFTDHQGPRAVKQSIDAAAAVELAEAHVGVDTWADGSTELVWAVQDDFTLEPVWRVIVHAGAPVHHDLLTFVNAVDGTVKGVEHESSHATGIGDVFYPNPYQTQGSLGNLADNNDATSPELEAQVVTVTLERLQEGTGLLIGDWVDLTLEGGKDVPHANEPDRVYQYDRDDFRFEEVIVYHTIDQAQEYIHSLGYDDDTGPTANGIRDFPTRVSAHWNNERNAFYSTIDDSIRFGDSGNDVDFAEDGDIIVHEYGHAIQHYQNPNWGGGEMGAMGEGFSDYLAASFFADVGDPTHQASHAAAVGEWAVLSALPGLRRVDGNKMYPEDLSGFIHADGEIWSSALWSIRGKLGRTLADQLILESHYLLAARSSMVDGALAVLEADEMLTGGANANAIRTSFEDRGILEAADDHGNDATDPTPISVPSSTVAEINYEADADFFEFVAVAGTTYEVQTSVNLPGDTMLTLYSSDGATQLAFDDNGGSDLGSRLVWTAPSSLTYLIAVTGTAEGVVYDLQIDAFATPGDDHGDATDAATAVATPSVTPGSIEVVGDTDAFSFDVELGSAYTVEVVGSTLASGRVDIVDGDGNVIVSGAGVGTFGVDVVPAATGTLYALVTGDSQGAYDFSVAAIPDDHGDVLANATPVVTIPGVTPGELEYVSDRDMFSFSGVAGVRYTLDMLHGSLSDSSLTLFDAAGTQLAFDDDSGVELAARIMFQPSLDGTYFVEVSGYGDEYAGTYSLSIGTDDHGGDSADATPIAVPGTATAEIELAEDRDVFEFAAVAGETIEITVDAGASGDSVLTLFDTDGATQLALNDNDAGGLGSKILWTVPVDGDYYFQLQGTVADPYAISISTVTAPADDHGNDAATATTVATPSLTASDLEVANDTDVFAFSVITGASYTVDVVAVSLVGSQLQIVDSSGTEIVSGTDSATFVPPTTGTYFAIVNGQSQGTYELLVEQTPDDHGESIGNATAVGITDLTDGEIEFLTDRDMFSFSAVAGVIYGVDVIQDTLADSVLRLFDNAGNQLVHNDDSGPGLAARITWRAPSSGTFFVEVSGFEDTYTGTYQLVVGVDDHANTTLDATPITLPGTANAVIEQAGDQDVFVFSATAGTTIEALVDANSTGDGSLTLYGPDGTSLAFDRDGGTGNGAKIVWTVATDGDYYLGVIGTLDTYTLSLNSISTPLDDHGSVTATATVVLNPSLTTGMIEAASDQDAFAFQAIAGASYAVELVLDSLFSGSLKIVDPGGEVIATSDETVDFIPTQTGTYFALVNGDSQGSYELSIKKIPDDHSDTFIDATVVDVPNTVAGELEYQSDLDHFVVDAVAGTNYRFEVFLGTLTDSVLRLFGADGTQLVFDDNSGVGSASQIDWTPTEDGVYFVQVGGFADIHVGTYDLTIAVDDHGSSATDATTFSVPGTINTEIEHPDDVDYFTFTGLAGTTLEIVIDAGATGDTQLTLFDADGVSQLATDDNGGTDLGSRILWTVEADQTYFVRVQGTLSTDPYILSVDTIATPADDHSDEEVGATAVGVPSSTPGVLEVGNDQDVFSFNVAAGASYSVAMVLGSLANPTLTVVDSTGTPMAPVDSGLTFLADQTGVYHAFVSGGSQGSYELSVMQIPDDHGDSFTDATAIAVPGVGSGELEFASDRDTFSFAAVSGSYYEIQVVLDTLSDSVLRLFDVDGTTELVLDDNSGDGSASFILWQAPADGTYFAQVSGFDDLELGTYELGITADDHGDATTEATLVVVPGSADVHIEQPDDVDYFMFSSVAGTTLSIDATVGVDGDSVLKLYGSDETTLLASNDNGGTGAGSKIVWTVPADGTYYVEVSGVESIAPYALDISAITAPLDDNGDLTTTATGVAISSVTAGSIEVTGDKDAFTFNVVAGASYTVEVTPSTLENAQLEIQDANGANVALTGDSATFLADATAAYFAFITGASQGDYELSVTKVPDDHGETFADATIVTPAETLGGQIDYASDRDMFAFQATLGGSYRFEVLTDVLPDSVLRLFSGTGIQLAFDDNSGANMGSKIIWQPTVSGTYYLEVGGFGDTEIGAYQLVTIVDDHGDTMEEATSINVGGTVDALMEHSADVDVFTFSTTEGDTLEIVVGAGADGDSQLALLGTDGVTQIAFDDNGGVDNGSMIRWTAPADGDYYLNLTGAVTTDPYALSITQITAPVDDISLMIVGNPSVTAAEIEVVNDTDTFAFPVTAGIVYRTRMIVTTLGAGEMRLTDSAGEEIQTVTTSDGVAEAIWTAAVDGTFFSIISGTSQGRYQFAVEEIVDDHGDELLTATPIITPGAQIGQIEIPGDRDMLEFSALAGTIYRLDVFLNTLPDSVLRLYDDTGALLEFDDNSGVDFASRIVWQAPADGTYYAEVGGFDDVNSGTYVVNVAIDDHGNSAVDATAIANPGTATADMEQEGDHDVFAFAAVAGTTLEITVDVGVGGDSVLTLYDTDGVTVLASNDNGGVDSGSRLLWTAPVDGDYFFGVSGAAAPDAYAVSIDTIVEPFDDHGSLITTATSVVNPSVTAGILEVAGDTDVFAYEVTAGASYELRLILDSLETGQLVALNAAGDVVATDSAIVTFEAANTGTFFATVDGDSQGAYEFSVAKIPDDHGDSVSDATLTAIPSVTTGILEYASDRDTFAIDAVGGVSYQFEVGLTSLPDSVLRLFSGDGTQLALDVNSGGGFASQIVWQPSADGTYYIQVGGNGDAFFGEYELNVAIVDHGDTSTEATPVAVPGLVEAEIEPVDDVDFFVFDAVAGMTYEIQSTSALPGDTTLTLYDADGTTQIAYDDNSGADDGSLIRWTASVDQSFFVKVAVAADSTAPITNYDLTIDTIATPLDDVGGTIGDATPLIIPALTAGVIDVANDTDVFSFSGVVGSAYSVNILSGTLETVELLITDSSGDPVFTSTGAPGLIDSFVPAVDDTFFLFIDGVSQGTYVLSMTQIPDDHGDEANYATSVLAPSVTDGHLEYGTDRDVFSFSATAGDGYRFEVVHGTLADSFLRLIDGDGVTELDVDNTEGSASKIIWEPTADGEYYLEVGAFGSAFAGTYQLDVAIDDHGDVPGDATSIAVPGTDDIQIEHSNDHDFFSFVAVANTTMEFDVSVGTDGDSLLTLFDTDGVTQLAFNDDGGAGAASRILWTVPAGGTYYLDVQGAAVASAYQLSIDTIMTPLDDHGNLTTTATVVTSPSVTPGTIEVANDTDAFAFQATSGASYSVELALSSLAKSQLVVVDAAGQVLESASEQLVFIPTATGTYYVLVDGESQGSYELSISKIADDHGDSLATATPAAVPSRLAGELEFNADQDAFAFTAIADVSYRFEVLSGTLGNSVLRLFDSNGTQLALDDNGGVGLASKIVWEAPADGTYYLQVGGFGNEFTGTYQLETTFPCDYVGGGDGCDINDLDALYLGTNGAPTLSLSQIGKWLVDASNVANPLKPDPSSVFLLGDVNLDGKVNSSDLGLLLNNYNDTSGLMWSAGNMNGDTKVNSSDLGLLLNNFGFSSVSAAAGFASVSTPDSVSSPAVPVEPVTGSESSLARRKNKFAAISSVDAIDQRWAISGSGDELDSSDDEREDHDELIDQVFAGHDVI